MPKWGHTQSRAHAEKAKALKWEARERARLLKHRRAGEGALRPRQEEENDGTTHVTDR